MYSTFYKPFNHVATIIDGGVPKWINSRTDASPLLFLGHNKGIYDLIDVIALHKKEFHGRQKLRVGGNREVDKVNILIKEKKISDIVSYVGWVSGGRKVELLDVSDAYILPSYKEGLTISILEAMSYGLPMISTKVSDSNVVKGCQKPLFLCMS